MNQPAPNHTLSNKRLLLGITGGIAAYKVIELVRLLRQQQIEVQVVMTEAACQFVTPTTLQAISGLPVFTSQWDARVDNNMAHINLSRDADLVLIAPASADFIAKLAHGLADDLLSTLCLARDCPLWIAPAMNRQMWLHPATQRNVKQLQLDGVTLLGPASGEQACGELGWGRMLEAAQLACEISRFYAPKPLQGKHIVMTAGPTYEPIDVVRGITNRSSGKMGYALAEAALAFGARVTLISGPCKLSAPQGAEFVPVQSALDMLAACQQHCPHADIFISVAAVADYRVAQPSEQKIKKQHTGSLTLELIPNPDILATIAGAEHPPFCVGFAAESENLVQYAEQKRRAKKLPMLVGNLAQQAIGSDDNELIIFDDQGQTTLPRADKQNLAYQLLQHISQRYQERTT